MTANEKRLGAAYTNFNMKPLVLEKKMGDTEDFMSMSIGFKKALCLEDKKDQKMVIPISGYSGHRRGDKSQNFFGKSFREVSF